MYYKLIEYKGFKILIFCTPGESEIQLLNRAKRRYELYESGKISLGDLTGESTAVTM